MPMDQEHAQGKVWIRPGGVHPTNQNTTRLIRASMLLKPPPHFLRGGCYKYAFYGIESHRCMEATPSLVGFSRVGGERA